MSLHHLIVDSVSWQILCQDLETLYHGAELGPPGGDIRQWSHALQAYAPSAGEVRLWEELAHAVAAEKAASSLTAADSSGHGRQFTLSAELSALLLGQNHSSSDINAVDYMLTALGYALRELSGRDAHFVTMESHGREAFADAPDVQDTLGWFTTMYPMPLVSADELDASLAAIKANRNRVPFNGIGYGAIRGAYGSTQAPLPEISFNYLGRYAAPQNRPSADRQIDDPRWHLDPALCGISKSAQDRHASDCLIDVTARCVGDRMIIGIASQLKPEDTERFASEFEKRLEQIADHVAKTRSPPTQEHRSAAAVAETEFEPYFVVNENAAGPTLFILPPGEGGAESYLNNIAKLLPGLRLVLFNNVHLHKPMQSFEEIAEYYLAHVRRLQPDGPYSFLGWSFGGVVSLEISLQLLGAGKSVANLLLIDPFLNVRKTANDLGLPEHRNSLDPINYRYRPNERGLRLLAETASTILLFKAIEPIETHESEEQRRVFEYYAKSPFNNLDTLLPTSAFSSEDLGKNSHFSWIADKTLVGHMCSKIAFLVQEKITT
jgi:N-(5-amino-5-carboxypentanoyl)-L-cysteinyl-D-valine synthase